jgi:hypothetical protein
VASGAIVTTSRPLLSSIDLTVIACSSRLK